MKHYDHIIRFAVLLAITVIAFFGMRSFLVPETFGTHGTYTYGYHRGASDKEQKQIPALYQGSEKCAECHSEEHAGWLAGAHNTVPCEACHGNWQAHNVNTQERIESDPSAEACLSCHLLLAARPEGFPQIESFAVHMKDEGNELTSDMMCTDCHDPHEPVY